MYQLRFYDCNVHKFKNLKIIKVYKFLTVTIVYLCLFRDHSSHKITDRLFYREMWIEN